MVVKIELQIKELEQTIKAHQEKLAALKLEWLKQTWIRFSIVELQAYLIAHSFNIFDIHCNPIVRTGIPDDGNHSENNCFIGVDGKYSRGLEDEGKLQIGSHHFREDYHNKTGNVYVHYQGMLWGQRGDSFTKAVTVEDLEVIDVKNWVENYRKKQSNVSKNKKN